MTHDHLAEIWGGPIDDPAEWETLAPRERARMRRLHSWLKEPLWHPGIGPDNNVGWGDALCILVGIDPEASEGEDPDRWSLLPGLTPPKDRDERDGLHAAIRRHVALIAGLRLPTAPPKDWIAAVAKVGIAPPWAAVVLASPVLRKTLPTTVLVALREGLGQPAEGDPRANGSYAARPDDWAEAVARAEVLWEQRKSPAEIADTLAGEGFSSSRKTIKPYGAKGIKANWIAGFEKGQTAADQTAAFRAWRDAKRMKA